MRRVTESSLLIKHGLKLKLHVKEMVAIWLRLLRRTSRTLYMILWLSQTMVMLMFGLALVVQQLIPQVGLGRSLEMLLLTGLSLNGNPIDLLELLTGTVSNSRLEKLVIGTMSSVIKP